MEIESSTSTLAEGNSSVEHTFSPLKTSDGGEYTCTATINIPQACITNLNRSATGNITVASECVSDLCYSFNSDLFSLCTVPEPTIRFTGRVVSPVNLSSVTLYAGTIFNLTCVVELVNEVDTNLSVLTVWAKNGDAISSDTGRISVDTEAVRNISVVYESDVDFDPLSNAVPGGDGGNYTCSATVESSEFTSGTTASGTQTITVEGITQYCTVQSHLTLLHRPGSSSSDGGA